MGSPVERRASAESGRLRRLGLRQRGSRARSGRFPVRAGPSSPLPKPGTTLLVFSRCLSTRTRSRIAAGRAGGSLT